MKLLDRLVKAWPYGVHALFLFALGLAAGAWWMHSRGGDVEAISNVAQLLSASVALGGLWLAFAGVQRQRRDAEDQAVKFDRQVVAAETAAAAAVSAATAAAARALRERRDQLARVAAQCESAAVDVAEVATHPKLAGMSMGLHSRRSPTAAPTDPAALPTVLHTTATALSSVLGVAGELPPRNIQAIASAIVKLHGAAETLALCIQGGAPDLQVMEIPVMQKNVAAELDQVARDLHAAGGEATRLSTELERERLALPS